MGELTLKDFKHNLLEFSVGVQNLSIGDISMLNCADLIELRIVHEYTGKLVAYLEATGGFESD